MPCQFLFQALQEFLKILPYNLIITDKFTEVKGETTMKRFQNYLKKKTEAQKHLRKNQNMRRFIFLILLSSQFFQMLLFLTFLNQIFLKPFLLKKISEFFQKKQSIFHNYIQHLLSVLQES